MKMHRPRLLVLCVLAVRLSAEVQCACDPTRPETLKARECSLCAEAERQPADVPVFFLKDANPTKPNRTLAMPRIHSPASHHLADLPADVRLQLWTQAVLKAKELWGDGWGLAYNGDSVRTQCHTHIHIGKLLPGIEAGEFVVVDGPTQIPAPQGSGVWIHPDSTGKLHVHTGEQITETVLLR